MRGSIRLAGALFASACLVVDAGAAPTPPAIKSVLQVFHGPSLLDVFRRPLGLAADSSRGVIVVADTGSRRIVTLDQNGRSRGSLSYVIEESKGRLCEPRCVATDARGRLYVVDALAPEIDVLTSMGSLLASVRLPAIDSLVPQPQYVAVGGSGRLYVACAGSRPGIVVMEKNGSLVARIGFAPAGTSELRGPACVAVNASETEIAVVDPEGEKSVRVYATDGTCLAAFGAHGEGEGTFSMAAHVTWGPDGTLWVTDTIRHSINVFDSRGGYRGRIGGFGHGPGEFNYPVACAFLARDRIAVLERVSARCQVLEVEVGNARVPEPGSVVLGSGSTGTSTKAEVR